jgi:hypothetical protein
MMDWWIAEAGFATARGLRWFGRLTMSLPYGVAALADWVQARSNPAWKRAVDRKRAARAVRP